MDIHLNTEVALKKFVNNLEYKKDSLQLLHSKSYKKSL